MLACLLCPLNAFSGFAKAIEVTQLKTKALTSFPRTRAQAQSKSRPAIAFPDFPQLAYFGNCIQFGIRHCEVSSLTV